MRSNDLNQCGAVVTYPSPLITAACRGVTCSPASGSFFPVGTTTVTCTTGTGAQCSFDITVVDTQPPTIACPANITTSSAPNACGAIVNYPAPSISDNCPGFLFLTTSPASGSTFPVGTTTVTAVGTDDAGNTASCSFTVTVNDTQPPTIICSANITKSTDPGECSAIVDFGPPIVTDNCPGAIVTTDFESGSSFPIGTTTVTATATDVTGNTSTCNFTVTVRDTEAPVLECPADIVTLNDVGVAGAVVEFVPPILTDNCAGVMVVSDPPSGSLFPIGTTTVTTTASDASPNSPDSTCTFNVTVEASINVKRPSGGDVFQGFRTSIRWNAVGNLGDRVKIDLYRNGEFVATIRESTPNDGKLRWNVSDSLPTGRGFKTRVSSLEVPSVFGQSAEAFRIRDPN
ncbi:MAG: HYR domain-containing protein [Candidatus Hydrogenedentes bacterium]|nr:HYR domain-containing protein [Candidatus Hydrogenedentota bacterium]